MTDVNTDQQDNGVESLCRRRSRHRRPARRQHARRRQRPLRQLRPAPGGQHLRGPQPVHRGDGDRADLQPRSPDSLTNVYVPREPIGTASTPAARATQTAAQVAAAAANASQASASVAPASAAGGARPTGAGGQRRQPGVARPFHGQRAQHQRAPHGAAVRHRPLLQPRHAGGGEPPGRRARHHGLLQPRAEGASLSDAQAAIAQAEADIGMPTNVRGSFQGTAQQLRQNLKQEPVLIAGGADRDLHRAGRALREPDPPDHRALDPALGRGRRAAGPDDVQDGVLDHRADRHLPPDRPGEEERHPDHRLRARRPAQPRPVRPGGRARGLPAALPARS